VGGRAPSTRGLTERNRYRAHDVHHPVIFGNFSPIASRTSTSDLPARSLAAANPPTVEHSFQVPHDKACSHGNRIVLIDPRPQYADTPAKLNVREPPRKLGLDDRCLAARSWHFLSLPNCAAEVSVRARRHVLVVRIRDVFSCHLRVQEALTR